MKSPFLISARSIMTGVAMIALFGCAVGPNFKTPSPPSVKSVVEESPPRRTSSAKTADGAAQVFVNDKDIPAEWWKLYGSEPLNILVEQALKNNPDIQAAQAALRQAQENVYAQEGSLFPSINLTPSVSRERFSPAAFGEANTPSSIFTLYNASVSVSYGVDIFGLSRRTIESTQAQADFQRYELEATYLTLTTNVVTAAIQESSLREQIDETKKIIDAERKQLDVLNQQLKLGGVARTSVLQQQTVLAQTEATLPALKNQLSQKRNQLAILTGKFPSEFTIETSDLTKLHLPEELPFSLPSKLVEQRPDIKAAEETLHAATAEIGVATANMLPQVTLTGAYGPEATTFSGLSAAGAPVWNIGAGLVQPIFRGGELLHARRAAVAAYDKAFAQYRSTVLSAFQNVADTLHVLQFDADTLQSQANVEQAASESLHLARVQFKAGAISFPQLLDAERNYSAARIVLVQAQAARLADTSALFQALGGGWWNRPETTKNSEQSPQTQSSNGGKKQ